MIARWFSAFVFFDETVKKQAVVNPKVTFVLRIEKETGGFEETEIQKAMDAGVEPITLGRRILRTETAGLTILSWFMYQLEKE